MEKSIYKYILRHTKKDQVYLVLLTLASMPLVYYSLEIPKLIINKAIGGGAGLFEVFGYEITQVQYLLLLSFLFLGLVIINGGMKYIINVYRGVLGERMLRRFRYTLYNRILRFPLPHFKNVSASEIIPMVTAETEPLGGFIGDSVALPVMQGGLLVTYLSFIFVQDFYLGLAAIALYPPQVYLIPRLQHKVNQLSKTRVQKVRKLADRIGESVTGIADIHANDTGHFERADISRRLGGIFGVRNEIYRRKFFIKFLNNFLAQLTPFFFYSIGGYLVLTNELSLGALVAVLAAYKDIAPPWKELLKFYQITEDIRVKYSQIIEQFAPDGMLDAKLLEAPAADATQPASPLTGAMRANRLSYAEDGVARVDAFSFEIDADRHTVILSRDGSAGDELTQLLARLLAPTAGSLSIGDADLNALPESVTGQRIGYCSATSRLFNASIGDNLYYGLKHQPQVGDGDNNGAGVDKNTAAARKTEVKESLASGNSTQNIDADWVDIGLSGAADADEFRRIVLDIIECVELDDELLTLALRTEEDIDIPERLAGEIVTLRGALTEQINHIESGALVEPLDPDQYIHNLTVEENLLFGTPKNRVPVADFLAVNPLVKRILDSSGLRRDLAEIGLELAGLMVELFSDVPDDSELFEQFSFIKADDLPDYRRILSAAGGVAAGDGGDDKTGDKTANIDALNPQQVARLSAVSFQLCPARHRLDLITPPVQAKVLAARKQLMDELGADNAQIRFFDRNRYNPGMSVQENLLFGRITYAKGHLQPRVTETIKNTLKSTGLDREIMLAGLNCPAGAAGSKLAPNAQQKLTLARALLKHPDILIVNNILSGLDGKSFARILDRVIARRAGRNLTWALNDPALAAKFQQALVVEKGKLAHNDSPQALAESLENM
ncbi:MAG: ABC transporter transmembrane domain-containing protein [Gammaproteobacteria bacterium]|nr:ABC transporter transmembrane domain-containing protein [Gammaproteobacteria bacterium]